MSRELFLKDQEQDRNMAKMMTQLDLFIKHMMGMPSCRDNKNVNVMGLRIGAYDNDTHMSFIMKKFNSWLIKWWILD